MFGLTLKFLVQWSVRLSSAGYKGADIVICNTVLNPNHLWLQRSLQWCVLLPLLLILSRWVDAYFFLWRQRGYRTYSSLEFVKSHWQSTSSALLNPWYIRSTYTMYNFGMCSNPRKQCRLEQYLPEQGHRPCERQKRKKRFVQLHSLSKKAEATPRIRTVDMHKLERLSFMMDVKTLWLLSGIVRANADLVYVT